MRTFSKTAAQGDVFFIRVDKLPEGLKPAPITDGHFKVAHSETGHDHVIDSRSAQLLIDETNAMIAYLHVKEATPLEHLRPFDTHEAIMFEPGFYQVRRQRENAPEGWRRVED
jgi:hypothetical protein